MEKIVLEDLGIDGKSNIRIFKKIGWDWIILA
jgi:hypothetical protein